MAENVPDAGAFVDYVRDLIRFGIANSEAVRHDLGTSADWVSGYRMALEGLGESLPRVPSVEETASLELRLADCLADAIDTPVLKVRDVLGGADIELRLGAFLPELSGRAAELLEEAGR